MRALLEEYYDIKLVVCIPKVNARISKIILHRAYNSTTPKKEADLFNPVK